MHKAFFYIVNAITVYRALAAFLLLYLIIQGDTWKFKWVLGFSFATDLVDGFLARQFKVTSVFGSRLDSFADDLTILIGIVGLVVFKTECVREQLFLILLLVVVYLFQLILALVRYGKPTSFHTYMAKLAMLSQGAFLILLFFLPEPPVVLFYIAAFITLVDLAEEILLVFYLPEWKTDVKGWFWLKKEKQHKPQIHAR